MRIGQLNHFVEVQKFSEVQAADGSGDREKVWGTEFSVWANIAGLSVREFTASRSTQNKTTHRVTIRFSDVPDGTCWQELRLLCDGQIYKINGALPDNKSGHEWITLTCESGSSVWEVVP